MTRQETSPKLTFADGSSIVDKYDSEGRKIAVIDQNGLETDYVYDQFGDLAGVIEPTVLQLPATRQFVRPGYQYAYDQYGDQISTIKNALSRTTSYALLRRLGTYGLRDAADGPNANLGLQRSRPDDLFHRLRWQRQLDYAYDKDGRVTTETIYTSGSTTPYDTVSYRYNQSYNSQGTFDDTVFDSLANSTTTTQFDVNGNVVQIASPQGTVDYSYDPATNRETEVYTINCR